MAPTSVDFTAIPPIAVHLDPEQPSAWAEIVFPIELRPIRTVRDVIDTMPALTSVAVDGGAAANDLLCQLQADQLGLTVERPRLTETTALGAAFLAGLGVGVWGSTDELRETWQLDRSFTPSPDREAADAAHRRWTEAVERSKGWALL